MENGVNSILQKYDTIMRTRFIWLRIDTSGKLQ
jgi:hypothetical protein